MKKSIILVLLIVSGFTGLFSQVGINTDGSIPANSSMLDVKSTEKGVLFPRMTTAQRDAIANPDEGLLIFNVTTMCFNYYYGGSWKSFCGVAEPVFQCGMKYTDPRDGKMYNTVKIGTQCWMAQNMNFGTMINISVSQTNNGIAEKYCYQNNEANCDEYGGLYQWDEYMDYTTASNATPSGRQGICPTGWHVPSDAENWILANFLGGHNTAGGKIKETGFTHWNTPNTGATNSSGFTALPGGQSYPDGSTSDLNEMGVYWSSTQSPYSSTDASHYFLSNYYALMFLGANSSKVRGFSARCLQD